MLFIVIILYRLHQMAIQFISNIVLRSNVLQNVERLFEFSLVWIFVLNKWREGTSHEGKTNYTGYHQENSENLLNYVNRRDISIPNSDNSGHCKIKSSYIKLSSRHVWIVINENPILSVSIINVRYEYPKMLINMKNDYQTHEITWTSMRNISRMKISRSVPILIITTSFIFLTRDVLIFEILTSRTTLAIRISFVILPILANLAILFMLNA